MTIENFLGWNSVVTWIIPTVLLSLFACTLLVAKLRTNRVVTPITTFLAFAVVHALGGYFAGFLTADRIGQTADSLSFVLNKALLVVGLGIAATFIGYILFPYELGDRLGKLLWKCSHYVSLEQLRTRSFILIFLSIALLVTGLLGLGGIPLFNHDLSKGRYDNIFRPAYNWVGFTANRGRDFIQLPAALLLMCWFRRRTTQWDLYLGIGAIASCLLILERTPLVDIGLMLIAILLLRGKTMVFCTTGLLLCFGYLTTQLVLDSKGGVQDLSGTFRTLATALPEVRDFAFMLIREPPRFHGLTILVGVLPVPGFVSDFTSTYLIRTVTLQAAGIPLDAGHGGLRITVSGEMYINFGYWGVAVAGFLLGLFCAAFEKVFYVATTADDIRFEFLVSTLWMFMFEIYLSGTGVFGMIKTLFIVLGFLLMAAPVFRRRLVAQRRPVLTAPYTY